MDRTNVSFPQYRRYRNGKNYFRIDSMDAFEEIRSLGEGWLIEKYNVRILPDHHLLNDLLFNFEDFAEEISPEAYETLRNQVK